MLPKITAKIFEYLQKGLMLSSNSLDDELRTMYLIVEDNYDELYDYFMHINYQLERGNEYFYFSRIEPKASLEQKLSKAYFWIDILDFFKEYDVTFASGTRFSLDVMNTEVSVNIVLQTKLDSIKKHFSGVEFRFEILQKIIDRLRKEGFIEVEDLESKSYKVMTSWNYLEQLIDSINIKDEIEDESSK